MAIFPRRILQKLINENDKFLPKNQTQKHVNGLNRAHKEATLAYEWEVVLLNAFNKVGEVEHEKDFGGKHFADIYFKSSDDPDHNFVAEITTVSDKGLKEQNPFDALQEQLSKIVKERGLKADSFSLYVEDETIFDNQIIRKVKLKLPGRSRFLQLIFDKKFDNFLYEILKDSQKPRTHVIKKEDADLTIKYNPNQEFASGSYRCYYEVFSKTENRIYQALYDKISQLHGTNFKGPLGIFLCDGSCSLLNAKLLRGSLTVDNIIEYFLRLNRSIYFVVTFRVEQNRQIIVKLYKGHSFNDMSADIYKILEKVITIIPKPESNAANAINLLRGRNPNVGRSNLGGHQMKYGETITEVKISARELLDLLAGEMEQREFVKHHGFIPSGHIGNPFNVGLKKGQLIDDISIEKSNYEDDDWITFKLKGPDPAISPYKAPMSKK